jgi:hypothetical protein
MSTNEKPLTRIEDFVPRVVLVTERSAPTAYGTMVVGLHRCGGCERWMVEPLSDYKPFPGYFLSSFVAQVKAAGWAINGYATKSVDGKDVPICKDCKEADVGDFVCALCGQARKSSQVQEAYGYGGNGDYLCKPCYESVPAKRWDDRCDELEKAHQYDHC